MTADELNQIVAALHGHAKWLRNYATKPRKYINPVPMAPDELDRIADRLATIVNQQSTEKTMSLKDLIGTPLEIEVLRENQQLREQNKQLQGRNAKLVAAIQRIDAINDRPECCFNQEISDVCDAILKPNQHA